MEKKSWKTEEIKKLLTCNDSAVLVPYLDDSERFCFGRNVDEKDIHYFYTVND